MRRFLSRTPPAGNFVRFSFFFYCGSPFLCQDAPGSWKLNLIKIVPGDSQLRITVFFWVEIFVRLPVNQLGSPQTFEFSLLWKSTFLLVHFFDLVENAHLFGGQKLTRFRCRLVTIAKSVFASICHPQAKWVILPPSRVNFFLHQM